MLGFSHVFAYPMCCAWRQNFAALLIGFREESARKRELIVVQIFLVRLTELNCILRLDVVLKWAVQQNVFDRVYFPHLTCTDPLRKWKLASRRAKDRTLKCAKVKII